MENNLTPQQQAAVDNRGGKLLVSAAAGSGKTKVLVDRLMGFILDGENPCNIDDFLIITYTKAAAAELRGKIAARMSEYLAEMPENQHLRRQMQRLYLAKISTVHAWCSDLLREFAYELNLPADFRVADENECRQLRDQVMTELLEDAYTQWVGEEDFCTFIDTQGLGKDDRMVPEILFKVYDSARCHLDPEDWLSRSLASADLTDVEDAAQTVWGSFLVQDLKHALTLQIAAMKRCIDLAEGEPLMAKPLAVLQKNVESLEHLADARTWDEIVERSRIDYGRIVFSKKIPDQEAVARIKAVRDGCKKDLEKKLRIFCDPSCQVLEDLRQTAGAIRGLVKLVREFGRRYDAVKRHRRVLDFSDLEHRTLDLLLGKSRREPTRIAKEVGRRFREILVDEYQDSNAVQDAIFSSLTREKQNCFMVGDVKQSIYQFRLADPGIFLEKYNSYAKAEDAQDPEGRKVLLSRNFRSGGAVLEATNDVFYRCMSKNVGGLDYGPEEALAEGIPHEPLGEPEVELHVLITGEDSYREEAAFVADRISELLSGEHMVRGKEGLRRIEPEDISILLRSPGSVGRYYQDALAAKGIESSFGGGLDLLQTGEIGFLRSLLEILSNPRQDIPLLAVLMSPVFGFTADDLARIRSLHRNGDVYDALLLDESPETRDFLCRLGELRRAAQTRTLAGLMEEIFCSTGLEGIYGAMESGVEHVANIREFFRLAVDFERTARRDLGQFLEYLDSMEEKGLTVEAGDAGGTVKILSIHKSKGLEYPVVFLSSLGRSFNRESLRASALCDGDLGIGLSAVDQENRVRYPTIAKRAIAAKAGMESLSEELRVLYVAMTRARDRLIMTYAGKSCEKELADLANRIDLGGTELLAGSVTSPGEWVLMEAMSRTEAGSLHAFADARPSKTHLAEFPWKIELHQAEEEEPAPLPELRQETREELPEASLQKLRSHLGFVYPHSQATTMASKQTATQLKGRAVDEEVAESAEAPVRERIWRPVGTGKKGKGREYGTAMHAVMQYVNFDRCDTREHLDQEIRRLTERRLLSPEQAEKIHRQSILAFFRTELGQKIRTGEVLREFKFSILEDAEKFREGLAGEQVLLQGVVDCALVEEDGITVVDFKTDYVTEETVPRILDRYRIQIDTYAKALERIYEKPVKARYLYLFHLQRLAEVL